MIRIAQNGSTIVPVKVFEKTRKQQREEGSQYWAMGMGDGAISLRELALHIGHGDSIEEAVDAVSEQL